MSTVDGRLRSLFQDNLKVVHWQSIETGMTGRGIPDMNGCYQGVEFWIENKVTDAWAVGLSPEQVGWHLRRARAGGRTFVAVRRLCDAGPRRQAADELHLYRGDCARLLKDSGLRGPVPRLGTWAGGPAAWDWEAVLELLVG